MENAELKKKIFPSIHKELSQLSSFGFEIIDSNDESIEVNTPFVDINSEFIRIIICLDDKNNLIMKAHREFIRLINNEYGGEVPSVMMRFIRKNFGIKESIEFDLWNNYNHLNLLRFCQGLVHLLNPDVAAYIK